ncbi:MAG: S-layer homology domain-containing protein [Chloroflexi bacterium]|nr:S-layer homology domain-containing protein [Chloroflexota bacterium]
MRRQKQNSVRGEKLRLAFILVGTLCLPIAIIFFSKMETAQAQQQDLNSAVAKYPNISNTNLDSCDLCHDGDPPALNPYGQAYLDNGRNTAAFGIIENTDSDGDGYTNIQEIRDFLTFPGDPASFPFNATSTPTLTKTPTSTRTPTSTGTSTPTRTPTRTPTTTTTAGVSTSTRTSTSTSTSLPATPTRTPTSTSTSVPSNNTSTPSRTPTQTRTPTATFTSGPVTLTPSRTPTSTISAATPIFADVPLTYWARSYIERLYNSGITGGCGASPLVYCPTAPVTRAQMAIFLVHAMHGVAYVPPTATDIFADVPNDSFGADYIEQLYNDGITAGCGGGNFCPGQVVTRAQMAIFLVRARHGPAFVPPTATGIFTDVPVGSFGADFIEQLAADFITSGCGAGVYCPSTTVKRDSMAVFLVKTFNLP